MPDTLEHYLRPILELPPLTIFALYTAANAALLLMLSILTVRARVANGVTLGDGGKNPMVQAIRAHGNASEYVPISLILLYALVATGAPAWVLHIQGVTLLLGRVFHALGLHAIAGRSSGRFFGMILTWTSMAIGIVAILFYIANK